MKSLLNSKLNRVVKVQSDKLRKKWRKIVTGDESKRVRDHFKEYEKKPKYIMTIDKLYFTFGVLNIAFTQYFLFNQQENFWLWYAVIMPFFMLVRRWNFKKLGWQYFMLDFCYFTLWSTFIMLFLVRQNPMYFKVIFIYANGPLTLAIILWRNSFVFHDYEKMTSVYLHLYPCLLTYALRWPEVVSEDYAYTQHSLNWSDIAAACAGYTLWQVLYYVKTEVLDKAKLDGNPKLVTSLRWLSADKKNSMGRLVLKLCRTLRLFGPTEEYDSTTFKTKLVFMASQFIYTVITFTPTVFLYHSQTLHLIYILFIFTMAVYYGASYYIEIFSARYQKQFDNTQHIQQVAQTAAQAAYSMAQLNRSLASEDALNSSHFNGHRPGSVSSPGLTRGSSSGLSPAADNGAAFSRANSHTSGISRGTTPMLEDVDDVAVAGGGGRTSRSSTLLSFGGNAEGSRTDLLSVCPEVETEMEQEQELGEEQEREEQRDSAVLAVETEEWERARDEEAQQIIAETTTAIVNDLMLDVKDGERRRLDSEDTSSGSSSDSDVDDASGGGGGKSSGKTGSVSESTDVSAAGPVSGLPSVPVMVQCLPDEKSYDDDVDDDGNGLPDDGGSGYSVFSSKLHWA